VKKITRILVTTVKISVSIQTINFYPSTSVIILIIVTVWFNYHNTVWFKKFVKLFHTGQLLSLTQQQRQCRSESKFHYDRTLRQMFDRYRWIIV